MKTIGLIGGMSWESSLEYYRIINERVKEKLGGLHSAQCLMYSVEFDQIQHLQHIGDWDRLTQIMVDAAQRLEKGGAEFVVICTNTMKEGATDFVLKPWDNQKLLATIHSGLALRKTRRELKEVKGQQQQLQEDASHNLGEFLGKSPAMLSIKILGR